MDINWQELLNKIVEQVVLMGPGIVGGLALFFFGRIAARIVRAILRSAMRRSKVDETLTLFIGNIAYAGLMAFVVIAAMTAAGIPTGSLVAIIATAGLAIGFALQGSLGNFAAGVMLIMFRPFKVGDLVEAGGITGVVKDIQIFNTMFDTPDNKQVIVPNSSITGNVVTNYSGNATRRVDLVAGIGYGDDIPKAKSILEDILATHPLVLKDPAPSVALIALADSSVNFNVRPWCKTGDYWACYSTITEKIKLRFDEAGINIPFPQRDVHLHTVA